MRARCACEPSRSSSIAPVALVFPLNTSLSVNSKPVGAETIRNPVTGAPHQVRVTTLPSTTPGTFTRAVRPP
jgi:hypothetical protein